MCLAILASALLSSPLHAEFFGLPNARSADLSAMPELSVEAAFVTGEYGELDYEYPGVRVNYVVSDTLSLYGDIGQSELADHQSTAFGGGFFFQPENLFEWSLETAFKGSIHRSETENVTRGQSSEECGDFLIWNPFTLMYEPNAAPCTSSFTPGSKRTETQQSISLEMLVSSEPIPSLSTRHGSTFWYGNVGVHRYGGDDTDTEIGFGGGLVMNLRAGQIYVGADMIDEMTTGVGYRYFLR